MPAKTKTMPLRFPALGVVRRHSFERSYSAASYPTPWATNVRLEDRLTGRLRGGSFTSSNVVVYLVDYLGNRVLDRDGNPIKLRTMADPITDTDDKDYQAKAAPVYRDRALTLYDNAIIASRVGTHVDTAISADLTDMMRPVRFQLSEAYTDGENGVVGGDVVALVPHVDKYLVCFTADETWVLSGDPLSGSLRRVSYEVGIVAEEAWCRNHDTVYFLSSHGLYSVGADGSGLKALSEDKIPEELTGVTDSTCTLRYHHADRGVYIDLSRGVSWFYDTARDQFWPFSTDTTDSHLLIGPIRLGNVNAYGMVVKAYGVLAEGSADVDWRIIKGDTAEAAAADGKAAIEAAVAGTDYGRYVAFESTWSAGRSHQAYPRVRSPWCCVWLHSEGDWAYENIVLEKLVAGRWR